MNSWTRILETMKSSPAAGSLPAAGLASPAGLVVGPATARTLIRRITQEMKTDIRITGSYPVQMKSIIRHRMTRNISRFLRFQRQMNIGQQIFRRGVERRISIQVIRRRIRRLAAAGGKPLAKQRGVDVAELFIRP